MIFSPRGIELKNMDTGEPLSAVRAQVQSANVYLGAFPLAEALDQGAEIVITGRCTDAALALGPMIHEFDWQARRLGQAISGDRRRSCHRMRRAGYRRQLPGGLGDDSQSCRHRLSDRSKPSPMGPSLSPNTRVPADA